MSGAGAGSGSVVKTSQSLVKYVELDRAASILALFSRINDILFSTQVMMGRNGATYRPFIENLFTALNGGELEDRITSFKDFLETALAVFVANQFEEAPYSIAFQIGTYSWSSINDKEELEQLLTGFRIISEVDPAAMHIICQRQGSWYQRDYNQKPHYKSHPLSQTYSYEVTQHTRYPALHHQFEMLSYNIHKLVDTYHQQMLISNEPAITDCLVNNYLKFVVNPSENDLSKITQVHINDFTTYVCLDIFTGKSWHLAQSQINSMIKAAVSAFGPISDFEAYLKMYGATKEDEADFLKSMVLDRTKLGWLTAHIKLKTTAEYQIHDIEGDGNCLIASVIHQIELNGEIDKLKAALGLDSTMPIRTTRLRSAVASYLKDPKKPWEASDDLGYLPDEIRNGACENIERNQVWCGDVELLCILSFLKEHDMSYQSVMIQTMEQCHLSSVAASGTKPMRAMRISLESIGDDAKVLAFGHLYKLHWDSLTNIDGKALTPGEVDLITLDGLFDDYNEAGSTAPAPSKPKSPFLEAGSETKKDEDPKPHAP